MAKKRNSKFSPTRVAAPVAVRAVEVHDSVFAAREFPLSSTSSETPCASRFLRKAEKAAGHAGALRACHVELVFKKGAAFVRACSKLDEKGLLIPVANPRDAQVKAAAFCACKKAGGAHRTCATKAAGGGVAFGRLGGW